MANSDVEVLAVPRRTRPSERVEVLRKAVGAAELMTPGFRLLFTKSASYEILLA
jgi:hypothetical protein